MSVEKERWCRRVIPSGEKFLGDTLISAIIVGTWIFSTNRLILALNGENWRQNEKTETKT
jgi:hypothetical protein